MEMETHQAAAGDENICRRHNGKVWRCKNISGDNQLQYCEHHYKNFTVSATKNPCSMNSNKRKYLTKKNKEEMEMELLPDEHFCSHTAGIYRCKNFRMSHGAAADDHSVPKTKLCEKHYNYYSNYKKKYYKKKKLLKKKSGDGEGAASSGPIETRDSNCSKLRNKDLTGIQPATTDIQGGSADVGAKRKNFERREWPGELDFTDFLIEKPSLITSNEMKKEREMEKKKLPPDEQLPVVVRAFLL